MSSTSQQIEAPLRSLFQRWDLLGEGAILAEELEQMLVTFDPPPLGASLPATPSIRTSLRGSAASVTVTENWAELLRTGLLPKAISQDPFVETVMQLLRPQWIASFCEHCRNTLELLVETNEGAQRAKAVWELFCDWDPQQTGVIDWHELRDVVCGTPPFDSDRVACDLVLFSVVSKHATDTNMQLRDFHRFFNSLLTPVYWPLHEFFAAIRELRRSLHEMRISILDDTSTTPLAIARRQAAVEKKRSQQAAAAERERRREKERQEGVERLKREFRHAWDGVREADLKRLATEGFGLRRPPEYIQVVTAPVLILLGIQPEITWQEDWFAALRTAINEDVAALVAKIRNFEVGTITPPMFQRILAYYYNSDFDPCRLLRDSPALAALCGWCKAAVRLAAASHGWQLTPAVPMPPTASQHCVFVNTPRPPPEFPSHPAARFARTALIGPPMDIEEKAPEDMKPKTTGVMVRPSALDMLKAVAGEDRVDRVIPMLDERASTTGGVEASTRLGQAPELPGGVKASPFLAHVFVQSSLAVRRQHTIVLEPQFAGETEPQLVRDVLAVASATPTVNHKLIFGPPTSPARVALRAPIPQEDELTQTPTHRQPISVYTPICRRKAHPFVVSSGRASPETTADGSKAHPFVTGAKARPFVVGSQKARPFVMGSQQYKARPFVMGSGTQPKTHSETKLVRDAPEAAPTAADEVASAADVRAQILPPLSPGSGRSFVSTPQNESYYSENARGNGNMVIDGGSIEQPLVSDVYIRRTTETHQQHLAILQQLNEDLALYGSPFERVEPEEKPIGPRPDFETTIGALVE
eukprot:TRINITY_DN54102_c0_g1_i1.p1 TRINITY_DN54102_c0_g1~~TRINITY_DN54102_c0_g1_i1.p1  ORF type:complete len:815 (+),score=75.47 TRINITY_DN54102_c0_g1_i1:45-2489(+)